MLSPSSLQRNVLPDMSSTGKLKTREQNIQRKTSFRNNFEKMDSRCMMQRSSSPCRTPYRKKIPRTPPRTAPKIGSVVTPDQRLKYQASPVMRNCGTDARFIPSRKNLKIELCRASIYSAEKRRRKSHKENNESNISSPKKCEEEVLTPLQTEFRRRMRGALFDVAITDSESMELVEGGVQTTKNTTGVMNSSFHSTQDSLNSSTSFLEGIFGNDSLLEDDEPVRNLSFSKQDSDGSEIGGTGKFGRMFCYKEKKESKKLFHNCKLDPYVHDHLRVLDRSASFSSDPFASAKHKIKVGRKIPTAPSRILDAPDLVDDYYLNLVSWGSSNKLAVALGQCVYLWHAATGEIDHLLSLSEDDDYVTSVTWCNNKGDTNYLAVGTNKAPIQIWDTHELKLMRELQGHSARVGSLSWTDKWLSSGSRDSLIIQHDLRSANNRVSMYTGHLQEVCGLKWNYEGTTLASGGNENYLCLWDAAMSGRNTTRTTDQTYSPRSIMTQHNAAVKALSWCPFQRGLLASGGGTADRTIKFWNTNSGALLNSIDTGSQVCSLLWSKYHKQICSSHGFSENQLILWNYPSMTKIQEFTGHTARVLHMEQSPDGAEVVSAAADETLRFWNIFGSPPTQKKTSKFTYGTLSQGMPLIR